MGQLDTYNLQQRDSENGYEEPTGQLSPLSSSKIQNSHSTRQPTISSSTKKPEHPQGCASKPPNICVRWGQTQASGPAGASILERIYKKLNS